MVMTQNTASKNDVFYLTSANVVGEEQTSFELGEHITPQNAQRLEHWQGSEELSSGIQQLTDLVANVTEAYTAAICLRIPGDSLLQPVGVHTLSKDFLHDATIPFGSGLIGWTAENGVRISVSPFEHDATTLLCYSCDQELKSFLAVPILDQDKQLLGVISCDSKKSYAFPKITEKLLLDCALQARLLLQLHTELATEKRDRTARQDDVADFLEVLRHKESEKQLLSAVARIPDGIVERDALVVMVTRHLGVGKGTFYSASEPGSTEHRLLELVCKHKKILCADRSVHALPRNDNEKRSFLSIPIRVVGVEAGSLNLLSKPFKAFSPTEIATLEKIASVVGQELERQRLRERFASNTEETGVLSWKHFSITAEQMLEEGKKQREEFSLLRFSIENMGEIEDIAGVESSTQILSKLMRLVEQVKGQAAVSTYLYGSQVLVLLPDDHAERAIARLKALLKSVRVEEFAIEPPLETTKLGEVILRGLHVARAQFPRDGESLGELCIKSLRTLDLATRSTGETAHAGKW